MYKYAIHVAYFKSKTDLTVVAATATTTESPYPLPEITKRYEKTLRDQKTPTSVTIVKLN